MNIQYNFDLFHVLVTGGASGIGLQVSRDFLAAGARVTIWDRASEALARARDTLSPWVSRLSTSETDVASFESCSRAADRLSAPIRVLVNNAGITRDKTFAKMTPEEFEVVVQTNLTGLFNVTKSVLGRFDAQERGNRIINMASVVAHYGNFGQSNYVAAKAGVIGLTKTLARELARKGFTVNAVAPGFTETPMTEAMPREVLDQMAARVPLGRLGKPADISNACLFLASEEAQYITGAIIDVNGGLVV